MEDKYVQEIREYSMFSFARDILTELDDFNLALVIMRLTRNFKNIHITIDVLFRFYKN